MILDRLSITRCDYDGYEGKVKGRYYGEATFQAPLVGRVQLNLGADASDAILKICADQVMDASKAVAEAMASNVLQGMAAPAEIEASTS